MTEYTSAPKRAYIPVLVLAAVTLSYAGCGRDENLMEPYPDGGTDAQEPEASVDALPPDGPPTDTWVCTEGTLRCRNAQVQICSNGEFVTQEICEFGCISSPEPHCGKPVFSNGITMEDMEAGTTPFSPGVGNTVIDTDNISITGPDAPPDGSYEYRIVDRASQGLPHLLILSFQEISIPEGANVRVEGEKPLAMLARDRITVEGLLDVGVAADGSPGPGGFPGGLDGAAGMGPGKGLQGNVGSLNFKEGGGGGAGFGAQGGNGGSAGTTSGGEGGNGYGNPQLNPLIGGSGGGSGGRGAGSTPGRGGSGGGAIMLASLDTVRVSLSGVITSGGGGGEGGETQEAGGGGGSGGGVLFAAPVVQIMGIVAVNGGGGGGAETTLPEHGENGQPSSSEAAGGTNGGGGGAGVVSTGESGEETVSHGGGGGGATGRIRIESRDTPNLTGVLSPSQGTTALSIGTLAVE